METKIGEPIIKKAGEGKVIAVIATLGTPDRDKDVLRPGAFGDQVVPIVGAHQWNTVPLGKSRVFEVGSEAVADMSFNLQTSQGREWYEALKFDWEHQPARQQYSWGFSVPQGHATHGTHDGQQVRFLHASEDGRPLPIHEISPVLVGAGINTRTLSVKSLLTDEQKQDGFEIQTLIFPKDRWDSAEACRAWASSHDFRTDKVDETGTSWRFRQADPGDFTRLRTICINPSRDTPMDQCRVEAVGGPVRQANASEIEEQKRAIGSHDTPTTDVAWDGNANESRIPTDAPASVRRREYAWVDPNEDPATRSAYKFPHHMTSADGTPGAANTRACSAGIAALNGGRGGTSIPEADRRGVYNHLAAHLRDAGMEPPELRSDEAGEQKRPTLESLIPLIDEQINHLTFVQDLRTQKGRLLSPDTIAKVDIISQKWDQLRAAVRLSEMKRDPIHLELAEQHRAWTARVSAHTELDQAQGQAIVEDLYRQHQQLNERIEHMRFAATTS